MSFFLYSTGLAILKLLKSNGSIKYNNTEISLLNNSQLRPLRKEIQMVFQDPYGSLSPRLSIKQIIEEGLLVHYKNIDKNLFRPCEVNTLCGDCTKATNILGWKKNI